MVRVRAFWLKLPCSSTAGTPEALSCLVSFLARAWSGSPTRSHTKPIRRRARCRRCRTTSCRWLPTNPPGTDRPHLSTGPQCRLEKPLDQDGHTSVQGGREQQALGLGSGGVQDPSDGREKPQVRHMVRLVE